MIQYILIVMIDPVLGDLLWIKMNIKILSKFNLAKHFPNQPNITLKKLLKL